MDETISTLRLTILILLMLVASSSHGIILKFMNTVEVDGMPFEHPFVQTLTMFMGNSFCMLYYFYQKKQDISKYGSIEASPMMKLAIANGLKTEVNPLIFIIPMVLEATSETLFYIGYINVAASVVQMLGGLLVLIVAVLSVLFLQRKQHRHHWLGVVTLFMGICLVATAAITGEADSATKNAYLGIPLLITSIWVKSFQYIVEEKLLGSYYLHPMKIVGWEGIYGTIFFLTLLSILQFIPCGAAFWSNGVVEDTRLAVYQISRSAELVIYVILLTVLNGAMNGLGLEVTKHASAANRVTLTQVRTVVIWLFFLIMPLIFPLRVSEHFHYLQLIGFTIILVGVIIYNEIVTLPWWGFDRYVKKNNKKVNLRTKSLNGIDADTQIDEEEDLFAHHASLDYGSQASGADYKRTVDRLRDTITKRKTDGRTSEYFTMTEGED